MKILAIGAHPDDIEIFFYGTLAACVARGDEVRLAVATDGGAGGSGSKTSLIQQRADETIKGLSKIVRPYLLNFSDGKLSSEVKASEVITSLVNEFQPDAIITHAPEDYHPDHRALSFLVQDAAGFKCPLFFADTLMGIEFVPEFYVDITEFFAEKTDAIMTHNSQDPKRFAACAKLQNRFRAGQCNAPDNHYAEAFRIFRRFPFAHAGGILPPAPPHRPFYIPGSNAFI
ncbi:MAG: PIG-L domain-containing protein [Gammaproteobacteria bacterium]|nr:PIG-L domain-containing protein [Gammaproteobacteria bacterium]|tara:strand:+ start:3398 stop:4087 length:690 start_codon:yes stop_codon:yes gene_type:complete